MRKILTFPDELMEKIEYYQKKVFYHQFLSSTITTLISLGIKYLEEGRTIMQGNPPYMIPQQYYPAYKTGQEIYQEEKNDKSK